MMSVKDREVGTGPELLYLSRGNLAEAGGESPALYAEVIERTLALHAEGKFVQPLKPYLRILDENGEPGHIADRIIAMPSYVGGGFGISGLKWIGSKHDNPAKRGMERASGLIVLNDPSTNYPIAVLEASLISSMRTAAVTVVGAKLLAREGFSDAAFVGCGLIAQRQAQSLIECCPSLSRVYLYDVSDESARRMGAWLQARYPNVAVQVEASAEAAVRNGEVVVTCTVADRPYIPFEWLRRGAFVSNVSIMDLHKDVFLKADKVVVDDWEQANREKKVLNQLVLEGRFSRDGLHAELGEIVAGRKPGRESPDETIVLNPMGMAIEDIACAYRLYELARDKGIGLRLPLYE
nr:2,3-diaminopropionate biosynthesis protein SbnB [Cohnella panacarvi]